MDRSILTSTGCLCQAHAYAAQDTMCYLRSQIEGYGITINSLQRVSVESKSGPRIWRFQDTMARIPKASAEQSAPTALSQIAERKVFEELAKLIKFESSKSVFAIGGSIPITALDGRFICESDESPSEDGMDDVQPSQISSFNVKAKSGAVNSQVDNNLSIEDEKLKDAIHRMRCDPITIRWDSSVSADTSHKVTLPCADAERPSFEQLLKDCQPATFGRGGEDILDESYRKAGKLDESAFCSNFNPHSLGIINTVGQALAPDAWQQTNETHGIRAELYKLNVW